MKTQRGIYIFLIMLWLGISSASAVAQIPQYDPTTGKKIDQIGEVKDYRTDEEKAADEAKEAEEAAAQDSVKPKVKQPLLSFYFDDSTRLSRKFFAWQINPDYNTTNLVPIDTLLNGRYQIDYPFMAIDGGIGSAYLGNVGSATIPLNYFSRSNPENFSFVDVWSTYRTTPEKVLFYNTRLPYSRLTYSMSGEVSIEENLFDIVLSHNINPSTSVNIVYQGDGTKGMYMRQNTLVWNLSLSASHTGKRWAIHGGYIYSGGEITESGGIKDDKMITDTLINAPNQIDVNLTDAENNYLSNTVWWTTSYAIPLRAQTEDEITLEKVPSIFVGNSFNWTAITKDFTSTNSSALYANNYIDPAKTNDQVGQQLIDTKFFVQIQPYDRNGVVGLISAGIGADFSTYSLNVPKAVQEEIDFGGKMDRSTIYLYGDIDGKISRYVEWDATARFNTLGYKIGDLDVKGNIKLSAFTKKTQQPLSLDGSVHFSMREPDFWEQNYYSNHFKWNNNFGKEVETEFAAKFTIKPINLELGANYSITTNKIYYDSLMNVQQFANPINNLGVYLKKDFTFGGVHLNHTLLMQLNSNDIVTPAPLLSAYISYFYNLDVVKDVLNIEMGIDGRYQTEYYGFGYNPALAQFYNQRQVQLGGFPYLDAFVSAKWKRLRILVKAQNWNVTLFGGSNYFMVAHYPQNRMMLKFKFSWSFYD